MDENSRLTILNKTILSSLEEIKEYYEKQYPDEYKIIKRSLSDVSRELNNIIIQEIKTPIKNETE